MAANEFKTAGDAMRIFFPEAFTAYILFPIQFLMDI